MRCPKCGYNSFDHNLTCPKCRKDLTVTRRLLNLTVPAPGPVNFFQTAGQRMVEPVPVLAAEEIYDDLQPAEELQFDDIAPAEITPLADGDELLPIEPDDDEEIIPIEADDIIEDIAPDEALDELVPDDDDIVPDEELDELEPDDDDIAPDEEQDDLMPDDDDIVPDDLQPAAETLPIIDLEPEPDQAEEEIEIEIEELEEMEAEEEDPAAAFTPPPGHQAAMDQIKTTLTETGDLNAPPPAGPELALDLSDEDIAPDGLITDDIAPDGLSLDDLAPDDIAPDDEGQALFDASDLPDLTLETDGLAPTVSEDLALDDFDAAEEVSLETSDLDLAIDPPEPVTEEFALDLSLEEPPPQPELEPEDQALKLETLPDVDVSIGEGDDFDLGETPVDPEELFAEAPDDLQLSEPDEPPAPSLADIPEAPAAAPSSDDLTSLVDDINLDDLDNKL